jgi:hypothetical protein
MKKSEIICIVAIEEGERRKENKGNEDSSYYEYSG